ncbi:MAG: hypothetical protein ABIE84_05520 [bacterium]
MKLNVMILPWAGRQYRLVMPALLRDVVGKNLNSYEAGAIREAHEMTSQQIQQAVGSIGGPKLRPHEVEVLEAPEYRQASLDCNPAMPDSDNLVRNPAFVHSVIRDGGLFFKVYYNRPALEELKETFPTTSIMAHEICGSLYGAFAHDVISQAGLEDKEGFDLQEPGIKIGISAAGEGWSVYLTSCPEAFSPPRLLSAESAYLSGQVPEEKLPALKQYLSNQHTFVALTLLKLEMAEGGTVDGIRRMVGLMRKPPIVETGDPESDRILDGFWALYQEANGRLGMGLVPREILNPVHFDRTRSNFI